MLPYELLKNTIPSSTLMVLDSNKTQSIHKSKVSKQFKKINDPVPRYFESVNQLQGYYSEGEYDLNEIFKLVKFESFFLKATQKKLGLVTKSGFSVHSDDDSIQEYLDARFSLMELQTGTSLKEIVEKIAYYLIVCSNAFLVKVRDPNFEFASAYEVDGKEIQPVVGLFTVHPTSLKPRYQFVKFKNDGQIKHRLELIEWLYVNRRGIIVKFQPEDVMHFKLWHEDGMTYGTPEVLPVIDDIKTLRKIEEDIELLIYRDLFPLIHYTVENPGMIDHVDGMSELDQAKRDMERMVQDGGIATDKRHEIKYIGSQGKHIEARPYLEYFQNRVFTGLNVSASDMGVGTDISGNTAQSMSKQLVDYAKYVQQEFTRQFDEGILLEIALQSPFGKDILKKENRPTLKFEEIDIEWKIRSENHSADQFTKGAITIDELRNPRGLKTLTDKDLKRTFSQLYGDMSGMEAGKSQATKKDLLKSSGTNSNVVKANDSESFILDQNISIVMLDAIESCKNDHPLGTKFNIKLSTKSIYSRIKDSVLKQLENGINDAISEINPKNKFSGESLTSLVDSIYQSLDSLADSVSEELCEDITKNTSKAIKRIDTANKTEQVKAYNIGYASVALSEGIKDLNTCHYDSNNITGEISITTIDDILPKHPNSKTILKLKNQQLKDSIGVTSSNSVVISDVEDKISEKIQPMCDNIDKSLLFISELSDAINTLKLKISEQEKDDTSDILLAISTNANKQVEAFLDTISEMKDQNNTLTYKYISMIEKMIKSIDGISQDNMDTIKTIVDSIPKEINITSSPIDVKVDTPPVDVSLTVQDQKIETKKVKKSITIVRDEDGNMSSVNVEEITDEE